ncbi:RlpA-like double-psi beta-barrel-protein domain-containing protein-containing protein [Colletotrichum cereale]|nr:RlpA-like double-psi beta-barrel-protein domain-containing protein-containing protein [Colletotrichum cereale]
MHQPSLLGRQRHCLLRGQLQPSVAALRPVGVAAAIREIKQWALDHSPALILGPASHSRPARTKARSWECSQPILVRMRISPGFWLVVEKPLGGDQDSNHFDIMIPSGGFGIFDGCTNEFGVLSRSECSVLPAKLRGGCQWRFDWFMNADGPNLSFTQVQCPAEIVARSGYRRSDDADHHKVGATAVHGGSGVKRPMRQYYMGCQRSSPPGINADTWPTISLVDTHRYLRNPAHVLVQIIGNVSKAPTPRHRLRLTQEHFGRQARVPACDYYRRRQFLTQVHQPYPHARH